jgi:hypothetical protein
MNRQVLPVLLLAVLLMILSIAGCSNSSDGGIFDPTIVGSGNVVSEGRSVAPFHSIDLAAVADLLVTQGNSQAVGVETDDNIIQHIFTSVSNGVLTISADVDYTTQHGVIVTLDLIELQRISLSGVGSITGQNDISATDLVVTLGGTGKITISGNADTLAATLSGVGDIDASGLQTETCTVLLGGTGDCRVNVTQLLNATISGIGDIYYSGNPPTINESITGTGSLIPI